VFAASVDERIPAETNLRILRLLQPFAGLVMSLWYGFGTRPHGQDAASQMLLPLTVPS
jgi:hypothetical protein